MSFDYADKIIPTPQVELGEILCTSKLIKQVINARDGTVILAGNLVECLIVDAWYGQSDPSSFF